MPSRFREPQMNADERGTAEIADEKGVLTLRQLTQPPSPRFWQDYTTNAAICQGLGRLEPLR